MQKGRVHTARLAILTILDEEFAAVERMLGPLREIEEGYYEPDIAAHDIAVMQAAARTNIVSEGAVRDLLEAFQPEVVIVCGIGGGVEGKDDITTGDVVVADYLHYSEFRKISEEGDRDRYLAYDQPSAMLRQRHVDPVRRRAAWKSRIDVEAPEPGHHPKVLAGPIIAGDKIIGNPRHPEHRRAIERYSDAIAVDMESYGAGVAMHMYRARVDFNPLLVVVRGISDIVARPRQDDDESATGANSAQRQQWKSYACAVAGAFTAELSDRLLRQADLRTSLRRRNPPPPGP